MRVISRSGPISRSWSTRRRCTRASSRALARLRLSSAPAHSRPGFSTPAWRRITRPYGPLGRRLILAQGSATPGPTLIERVNSGARLVAPPPATPAKLSTLSRAGASLAPPWVTPGTIAGLELFSHLNALELLIALLLAALLFAIGGGSIAIALGLVVAAFQLFGHALTSSTPVQDLARRVGLRAGTLTADQVTSTPMRPAFVPKEWTTPPTAASPLPTGTTEQPAAARFRAAAGAVFAEFQTTVAPGPVLQTVDLAAIRSKIISALDPAVTIAATFRQRLGVHARPPVGVCRSARARDGGADVRRCDVPTAVQHLIRLAPAWTRSGAAGHSFARPHESENSSRATWSA